MHDVNGPRLRGMHILRWLFWFVAIAPFFRPLTPVPQPKSRKAPFQILQRRYATVEISEQEYEECTACLDRDEASTKRRGHP